MNTQAKARTNIIYLDLETQKTAEQVGGWENADQMLVSVACIYDSKIGVLSVIIGVIVAVIVLILDKYDLSGAVFILSGPLTFLSLWALGKGAKWIAKGFTTNDTKR